MTPLLLLFVFVTYSITGVHGNGAFGTKFIFTFPYQSAFEVIPSVFVSTQVKDPVMVTVSVPGIGFTHVASVTRDQGTRIDLPEEAAILYSSSVQTNKTVVVHAGSPVSIHGYYTTAFIADGFLVIPTTALGKNYVAVGYPPASTLGVDSYSEFTVSAIEDNTTVSMVSIKEQREFTISLKQLESYQFVADSENITDVTGMLINADKIVSVMSGHQATVVTSTSDFDYLMENIPPVSALGQHYILAPFLGRTSGFVYRIVATSSGVTNVTISGVNVSLSTGEFYEGNTMTSEDLITMLADKPIMVCQYSKGYQTDKVGDPFMVLLPSIQAFYYNVTFPVAKLIRPYQQYFISITTKCGNIYSFYLDGLPLCIPDNGDVLQTSDGTFCVLRTPITTGFHSVTHPTDSFLVIVYGFARREAYGYVAGYNVGLNMTGSADTSINGIDSDLSDSMESISAQPQMQMQTTTDTAPLTGPLTLACNASVSMSTATISGPLTTTTNAMNNSLSRASTIIAVKAVTVAVAIFVTLL
ncbi:uncharacterized protein [Amphiura filiformis]|uniref:uncharacterized protein n=1 Tax=Amphiura filiformis TaxID=82378 RepID=UPI003B2260B3